MRNSLARTEVLGWAFAISTYRRVLGQKGKAVRSAWGRCSALTAIWGKGRW